MSSPSSGAPSRQPRRGRAALTAAVTAAACGIAVLFAPAVATAAPAGRTAPAAPAADTITVVDEWESDADADGVVDMRSTQTMVLTSRGVPLSATSESDVDGDGEPESRIVETYTYDARGRLILRLITVYRGADTLPDESTTVEFTYGKRGELTLSTESVDSDGDGDIDDVTMTEISTSRKPAATTTTVHGDADGDGDTDDLTVYYWESDHRGFPILSRETTDIDDDGTVDQTVETTNTFSPRHGILTERTVTTGIWENSTSEAAYTYGTHGQLTDVVRVEDGGVTRTTLTYDDQRRLIATHWAHDPDGDGVVDSTTTIRYTLNADGSYAVVTDEVQEDITGPSPSSWLYTYRYTYDDAGRTTEEAVETDSGIDGVLDASFIRVSVYDDAGNLVAELTETDEDGDGTVDSRGTTAYTYDGDHLVSAVWEYDNDADGVVDSRDVFTRTES